MNFRSVQTNSWFSNGRFWETHMVNLGKLSWICSLDINSAECPILFDANQDRRHSLFKSVFINTYKR